MVLCPAAKNDPVMGYSMDGPTHYAVANRGFDRVEVGFLRVNDFNVFVLLLLVCLFYFLRPNKNRLLLRIQKRLDNLIQFALFHSSCVRTVASRTPHSSHDMT